MHGVIVCWLCAQHSSFTDFAFDVYSIGCKLVRLKVQKSLLYPVHSFHIENIRTGTLYLKIHLLYSTQINHCDRGDG